jgi:hypothetical protein
MDREMRAELFERSNNAMPSKVDTTPKEVRDVQIAKMYPRIASFQQRSVAAFLIAIVLGVAGCAVRLIGDYDDTIDKGITDVQQTAESYFTKLESAPGTPFDQTVYDGIKVKLVVLKSRAASLPKYSIIENQIDTLQGTFDLIQRADKITGRPLANDPSLEKPPFVANSESAITTSVESILKLELALKRGDTPSNAGSSAPH